MLVSACESVNRHCLHHSVRDHSKFLHVLAGRGVPICQECASSASGTQQPSDSIDYANVVDRVNHSIELVLLEMFEAQYRPMRCFVNVLYT